MTDYFKLKISTLNDTTLETCTVFAKYKIRKRMLQFADLHCLIFKQAKENLDISEIRRIKTNPELLQS